MRKCNCIIFSLAGLFLFTQTVFAVELLIPLQRITIGQQRLAQNGVLVSRPLAIDEQIVSLVRQNNIQTINDYAAWLKKHMTYAADGPADVWLQPSEFLKARRGDCEDFAFFNSRVLRVLGYLPYILTLHSAQSAHAICVFEYAGKFYWFDNEKLKISSAASLKQLAVELTEKYHYSATFQLDPISKTRNVLHRKT